ncbi:LemA family protein [Candidatus Woesearchaeota archaeon]|nr:LemA family protein [Candidatus Woesearchaeota archaeon]
MAKKLGTGAIVGIVVAAVVVLLIFVVIGMYNGLVNAEVNVDNSWAQVETSYQRRADLIPNLVETVKGYRDFEQETLLAVTNARTAWMQAGTPQEKVKAANQLEGTLKTLFAVAENYPDLKANQNFLALQDELAGTENRISVERKRYNDAVGAFNKKTRMFPTNIVASMFGFEAREFFEAVEGAETAPQVSFT